MKKSMMEVAKELVSDMLQCGVITQYQKDQYELIILVRDKVSRSMKKPMKKPIKKKKIKNISK